MARFVSCALCGLLIVFDGLDAVVQYQCGHLEHEECYFEHYPHNAVCVVCRKPSQLVYFMYVEPAYSNGSDEHNAIAYFFVDNNPLHKIGRRT